MMGLTPRERELLVFLRTHQRDHCRAPSFREMMVAMGLASKGGIVRMVDALVAKGYVSRIRTFARSLQVLNTEDDHAPDCRCDDCGQRRYIAQLKLIQGLKVEPPIAVLKAKADNFRRLPDLTRAALLGVQPRPTASRKRAALPQGGI